VTAQVTELNNRETALSINESQLTSSVALIQALGGGWTSEDLPKPAKVVAH
jgi:outer membrane protein TolC